MNELEGVLGEQRSRGATSGETTFDVREALLFWQGINGDGDGDGRSERLKDR